MPAALPMALRARFQDYITEGLERLDDSGVAFGRFQQPLVFAGFERFASEGKSQPEAQGRPKGHGKLAPHLRTFGRVGCAGW